MYPESKEGGEGVHFFRYELWIEALVSMLSLFPVTAMKRSVRNGSIL